MAGLRPGNHRNRPSGRPKAGRRTDFGSFPVAVRLKSGPEGRFPARKHYCVTWSTSEPFVLTSGGLLRSPSKRAHAIIVPSSIRRLASMPGASQGSPHTLGFLMHGFWAGRPSSIFGVRAAPAAPQTIQKCGGRSPPDFGMVFWAPGAAQAPKIDDFRPAQNSCIKNPSVRQSRSFKLPAACLESWAVPSKPAYICRCALLALIRRRPLGTNKNILVLLFLGGPESPQKPLPGTRNRPLGPRNEVPEPSRRIPGSAKIRQTNKK